MNEKRGSLKAGRHRGADKENPKSNFSICNQRIKTLSSAFTLSFWKKGYDIAEYMDCFEG
ncbi:hypothetical protein [Methanosarcina acetivorans]|uniref:hypothetical protein n=1 Tax=Methanosarcina acetivorans TaxID=2214 RepID=UPI00064EC690|nr:hypothetical protein [Methanosarcina acetivorans]